MRDVLELAKTIAAETGPADSVGLAARLLARDLIAIADRSVSVLRMIDARRDRGVAFDDSCNEQELRRALSGLTDQEFPPSVVDEVHDFQRLEDRTRGYGDGRITRQLRIVCRCGWSSHWIDRDLDGDVAVSAARVMLEDHVEDAVKQARWRP